MHHFHWKPNPRDTVETSLQLDNYHCSRRLSDVRHNKTPIGQVRFHPPHAPTLLLFYDIETTGLSTSTCAMTQLAVQCVLRIPTNPPQYKTLSKHCSYVYTDEVISNFITSLTGIRQEDVNQAPSFASLIENLHRSVNSHCQQHHVSHCFWIAHNGFRFDQLILSRYLQQECTQKHQYVQSIGEQRRFWCVDTYVLSKHLHYSKWHASHRAPTNHKLQTLHAFFELDSTDNATSSASIRYHRADVDVQALIDVFRAMERLQPDILFSQVAYDTYFIDKMSTQRMVNNISFDQLQGVRGQTIQWTMQQQKVLGAPFDQHICIVAGAGCAKTTTLLGRILCLLRSGVPPQRIMLATFSRDATDDMVERLTQWVGTEVPIVCGTFDALARRYLKDNDEVQFDACQDVGDYKHAFLRFLETSNSPQRKSVLSSIDYMLVDEYQDINDVYHNIILAFARNGTRITAVGDDAQNIYTWNGSDIQYILEFGVGFNTEEHNSALVSTQTYYLTQNFRSTPEIIQLANASIARNVHQLSKTIEPTLPSLKCPVNIHIHHSWIQEANAIMPLVNTYYRNGKTVAFLCRNCTNNGPLYFYESQCAAHHIPSTVLERYHDYRNHKTANAVTLCTIHKSKGLEWDVVIVIGCTDTHFPSLSTDEHATAVKIEEERRLFYVATTRAKEQLIFTACTNEECVPHNRRQNRVSRFLTEVPRALFEWQGGVSVSQVLHTSPIQFEDVHSHAKHPRQKSLQHTFERLTATQWQLLRGKLASIVNVNIRTLQTSKTLHSTVNLPPWVEAEGIYEDIERWCVCVVSRMIGVYQIDALEYLNTNMYLSRQQIAIYTKYKEAFSLLSEDNTDAVDIDPDDIRAFHRLYSHCQHHAQKHHAHLSDLRMQTRRNLPLDIRTRLTTAYTKFKNRELGWRDVLWDAFEVSWYESLHQGRMRMLHQHVVQQHARLKDIEPLMCAMEKMMSTRLASEAVDGARVNHEVCNGEWYDTAPLHIKERLFFVCLAKNPELSTHRIIALLWKALMWHRCGYTITQIDVYYPHLGTIRTIDIPESMLVQSESLWTWWEHLLEGNVKDIDALVRENTSDEQPPFTVQTEEWTDCQIKDPYKMNRLNE